jgi:hypothetical protein
MLRSKLHFDSVSSLWNMQVKFFTFIRICVTDIFNHFVHISMILNLIGYRMGKGENDKEAVVDSQLRYAH